MIPLNPKLIGGLVLGAILLVAVSYHFVKVSNLQTKVAEQRVIIIALQTANEGFKASAEVQNKAIQDLIEANKSGSMLAEKAIVSYEKSRKSLQSTLNGLLEQKPSGDMLTDCIALDKNLTNEIESRVK